VRKVVLMVERIVAVEIETKNEGRSGIIAVIKVVKEILDQVAGER
jgi:hypothetical protein